MHVYAEVSGKLDTPCVANVFASPVGAVSRPGDALARQELR